MSPEQLRYHVPEGQDPAAVTAALAVAGFDTAHEQHESSFLLITMPRGAGQREDVRRVLQEADQSMGEHDESAFTAPVRFVDEVPGQEPDELG